MPTLHIEHAITDLATWTEAFEQFAEVRARAGVRAERVQQPVGDARYIVVDLTFDTCEAAEAFRRFLEGHVWSNTSSSPALAGPPRTVVLEAIGSD